MLILFDHGTPKGLIRALSGHMVFTAQARGWDQLSNGALLSAAEEAALICCSPLTGEFVISRTLLGERLLLLFWLALRNGRVSDCILNA